MGSSHRNATTLTATVAVVLVGALALPGSVRAATWTGEGANNGWSTAGNWDPGEPAFSDDAAIDNGDTLAVTQDEEANSLLIDGSTIQQTGGNLHLGLRYDEAGAAGNRGLAMSITDGGRYELSDAVFNNDADNAYAADVIIGHEGAGTFIMSGDASFGSANRGQIDDVRVGNGAGGDGVLRIEGGSFRVLHDNSDFTLGDADGATGRVEISGSAPIAIRIGQDFKMLSATSSLAFEIDAGGATPVSIGHADTPDLVLAGALDISLLAAPPESDIPLITLQQAPTVASGTFSGLAEGGMVTAGFGGTMYGWRITYAGGDFGGDVILQDMRVVDPASLDMLTVPSADGGGVDYDFRTERYEIRTLQYCDFLNVAETEGRIAIADGRVRDAASDQLYCLTDGAESASPLIYDAAAAQGERFAPAEGKERHPMVFVSWFGAAAFCNHLSAAEELTPVYDPANGWAGNLSANGFRLPTEEEWYKAAAWDADTQSFFTYGTSSNQLADGQANYLNSGDSSETEPVQTVANVGSTAASPYGLVHMSGNAWEWCHGFLDATGSDEDVDPHAVRGGGWGNLKEDVRTSSRCGFKPGMAVGTVGFRVVTTAAE